MDLVQDHQRLAMLCTYPVQRRMCRDLRVRDRDTSVVPGGRTVRVAEVGVDRDADLACCPRPLVLEMLGRRDDRDRLDRVLS